MNKTFIGTFFLATSLFATGCSQDSTASNNPSQPEEKVEEVETKEETVSIEKPVQETKETEPAKVEEEIVPEYRLQEHWNLAPIDPEGKQEVVLLTIDDAPDKYALKMAKTLKDLNAEAIFFVNGHFLDTEEEKSILKEIYDMGFEIGNHTYTHQALPDVSEEAQKEEIIKLSNLVEEITGERPKFFRAPHGMNTDFSRQLVKEEGMLLMNWTYGYDWEKQYMSKETIADIMVNTELLSNGSNLLMHDREWTAEGLADIVEGLREKGFEILDPELIETPVN